MLLQLSNLEFFHFLYSFHKIPDERIGNYHKSRYLIDQIDHDSCIWSHNEDKLAYVRLMITEFFFRSINFFYIAGTL